MFEKIRDKMRELVRSLQYVMTVHSEEEMENDSLSILDVESAILNGEIVERQKDLETGELKYVILGQTIDDQSLGVVAKLSTIGKLVIITVFLETNEYEN